MGKESYTQPETCDEMGSIHAAIEWEAVRGPCWGGDLAPLYTGINKPTLSAAR